ncbi:hypothetical protein EPK99_10140 [Neorhizobium lilium]|uniref:Uncharacterized protein n=1 Tax=Neorhizobium lilium TaxID=2503024 RepID=A0A3S3VPG1_9HYPH|nr:hypothetical protein [Neorhizobium lilium]RWX78927.1 hypothetical protein EPK99_10140 [Neorhizobium lilium]
MADFVAVIRRAVDGLATNTPETRAKVYEKARGAVQRQLENMKPRPPEEMLRRQMDKLQAAIEEVETEHQEASTPAEGAFVAPVAAPEPVHYAEPDQQAPVYEEPVVAAAPAVVPVDEDHSRYYRDEPEQAPSAPVVYHEPESEPLPEPVAVAPAVHDEHVYEAHPAEPEPAETHEAPWNEHHALDVSPMREETYEVDHHSDLPVTPEQVEEDFSYSARNPYASQDEPVAAPVAPDLSGHGTDWHAEQAPDLAEQTAESWNWHEPAPVAPTEVAAAWDDVPELVPAGPVESIERGPSADNIEAHFDQETHVTAEAVRMPAVADLPELAAAANAAPAASPAAAVAPAFEDPFADYVSKQPSAKTPKDAERDPWGDLEDLIGYNNITASEPAARRTATEEDDLSDLMQPPAKPYRVTPVRKRNYSGIVLALIGLVLLGGGGYAIWMNRDALTGVMEGLMQPDLKNDQSANQAKPAQSSTPATPAPAQTATQTPPAASNSNTAASAAPSAADSGAAPSKFTQRLMPDGKEVDEGPGATGGLAQNAEGQSVAQLNAPPANPAPAAQASNGASPVPASPAPSTGAAPATVPSAPAQAPAANPADTPAVAGEKMFLYEERIGQTAPTALDGTVSWSLQREPGANGAPPEPVVQGRITIPGRGLTALMTFKRNTDPSLPASHLIEIVFAVPPDFEGGAIDSVQRIAMKQTEQDRGNALIAVPAKITDDFHMIALNDFPDARNTNLDLLRTRNWIDIPVAYRNGRRALLTLQKGPEGEKAFNEAIREWAQMAPAPTGQ